MTAQSPILQTEPPSGDTLSERAAALIERDIVAGVLNCFTLTASVLFVPSATLVICYRHYQGQCLSI